MRLFDLKLKPIQPLRAADIPTLLVRTIWRFRSIPTYKINVVQCSITVLHTNVIENVQVCSTDIYMYFIIFGMHHLRRVAARGLAIEAVHQHFITHFQVYFETNDSESELSKLLNKYY